MRAVLTKIIDTVCFLEECIINPVRLTRIYLHELVSGDGVITYFLRGYDFFGQSYDQVISFLDQICNGSWLFDQICDGVLTIF